MRKAIPSSFLIAWGVACAILMLASPVNAGECHTWTTKSGKTLEAEYVRSNEDGTQAELRASSGAMFSVQVSDLIPIDQAVVSICRDQLANEEWSKVNEHRRKHGVEIRTRDGSTSTGIYHTEWTKDLDEWLPHLKAAAREGHAEANHLLALCYLTGARPLEKDHATAEKHLRKAVDAGYVPAMYTLGRLYQLRDHRGMPLPDSIGRAKLWFSLAAEEGYAPALLLLGEWAQRGDDLREQNALLAADCFRRAGAAYLKYRDIYESEGREMALRCANKLRKLGDLPGAQGIIDELQKTRSDANRSGTGSGKDTSTRPTGSAGTGFLLGHGYVVTCCHVVEGHKGLHIVSKGMPKTKAIIVAKDTANDIALLRLASDEGRAPTPTRLDLDSILADVKLPDETKDTPTISPSQRVNTEIQGGLLLSSTVPKTGEGVFTVGYPHVDFLGSPAKYTEGSISATDGFMDDPRLLQVSVPVQAGNSGGPLLNGRGEVVGIITAKLAAAKVFEWTGDLPQNVNYAIKASYLKALMDSAGVPSEKQTASGAGSVSRLALIEAVTRSVVRVIAE